MSRGRMLNWPGGTSNITFPGTNTAAGITQTSIPIPTTRPGVDYFDRHAALRHHLPGCGEGATMTSTSAPCRQSCKLPAAPIRNLFDGSKRPGRRPAARRERPGPERCVAIRAICYRLRDECRRHRVKRCHQRHSSGSNGVNWRGNADIELFSIYEAQVTSDKAGKR